MMRTSMPTQYRRQSPHCQDHLVPLPRPSADLDALLPIWPNWPKWRNGRRPAPEPAGRIPDNTDAEVVQCSGAGEGKGKIQETCISTPVIRTDLFRIIRRFIPDHVRSLRTPWDNSPPPPLNNKGARR